jgi:excisionase family DNA binding protein
MSASRPHLRQSASAPTEVVSALGGALPHHISPLMTTGCVRRPRMRTGLTRIDHATTNERENTTRPPQRHQVLPILLTVDEAADVLRTTRRAIYAMVEHRQLPGVVRIRRRVLVRADALLHWLEQKSAPSLEER